MSSNFAEGNESAEKERFSASPVKRNGEAISDNGEKPSSSVSGSI